MISLPRLSHSKRVGRPVCPARKRVLTIFHPKNNLRVYANNKNGKEDEGSKIGVLLGG